MTTADPSRVGEFAGRVALVTGAGANLGRELALEFARRGAAVGVHVRANLERAQNVVDEIERAGGCAIALAGDVADPDATQRAVAACRERYGPITLLVHGAAERSIVPFEQLDVSTWRRTIGSILDGAFHAARCVVGDMVEQGRGRIVFIGGSVMSSGLPVGNGHVGAAKAGLVGLARCLAQDFGARGVTVNVVSPGAISVPERSHAIRTDELDELIGTSIIGRMVTPEEVVAAAMFLSSDLAGAITAQVIAVDGGLRGLNP